MTVQRIYLSRHLYIYNHLGLRLTDRKRKPTKLALWSETIDPVKFVRHYPPNDQYPRLMRHISKKESGFVDGRRYSDVPWRQGSSSTRYGNKISHTLIN